MPTRIYWSSRDLSSFPAGNHQFILVTLANGEALTDIIPESVGRRRFVTLSGQQPDGNLIYVPNDPDDVASVKEVVDPSRVSALRPDLDLQTHRVRPPGGGDLGFAQELVRLSLNYERNTENNPISYDLWDENCCAWVNTLFKVAGVPKAARVRAGEFLGVDWGEEDLLDEALFR